MKVIIAGSRTLSDSRPVVDAINASGFEITEVVSGGATGAGLGQSLRTIGAILGHASQATTQRYAHVAPSPAKEAATATSRALAKAMRKKPRPGKP